MTITRHAIAASMVLPEFYQRVSLTPVYADGFQSGITAWNGWSSDDSLSHVLNPDTGRYEMRHEWVRVGGPAQGTAYHLNVPVTAGKAYQLVVHARGADTTTEVSCSIIGGTPVFPTGAAVQLNPFGVECTYLLTATGSTVNLYLELDNPDDTAVVYWQDVALYEMESATVLDLAPISSQITLDESWSPFVRASLTCPIPAPEPLALIDPRSTGAPDYQQPQWVDIELTQTDTDSLTAAHITAAYPAGTAATFTAMFAGQLVSAASDLWGDQYNPTQDPALTQTRRMSLMMRTRDVDWLAGTMRLDLTSDEMLLHDLARYDISTSDQDPPDTASLRSLVRWVLSLVGATLSPLSTEDAVVNSAVVLWELGDSAWSFLDPFIRTNGLRLYADEERQWWLEPPVTGATGTLELSSITSLRDVLSREDEAYGNGAVVVYEWFDALGVQQRQYQFAFVPGTPAAKIVTQKFTTPNPNLAAAPASALATRAATRGRNVALEAVSDYRADPGQSLVIWSPVTSVNGAMVSAVTWRFPEDRMDITTRDTSA